MTDNIFDLAIIGGGPAGLTAAIYGARARLKTAIIADEGLSGTLSRIDIIENYPGFPGGITGAELAEKIAKQALDFGAVHIAAKVSALSQAESGGYILSTESGEQVMAKSVIIATGARHKKLAVPGEEQFSGKGVSYCATCDGAFFKNKEIVVVGGGDSAVKEALYLTRYAAKVTIIHRRDALRAEKIIQEKAFSNEKIVFKWNSVVTEIVGDRLVKAVKIKNIKDETLEEYPTRGVFIFVGVEPNSTPFKEQIALDAGGNIVTGQDLSTSLKGIWAAGDVRSGSPRQVATAVGDGTLAAMAAIEYIEKA